MTGGEDTPARQAYRQAMRDARDALERLVAAGREDRAFGLATAVDLGTSAAFLFDTSDRACRDATNVVREAIAQAEREED